MILMRYYGLITVLYTVFVGNMTKRYEGNIDNYAELSAYLENVMRLIEDLRERYAL